MMAVFFMGRPSQYRNTKFADRTNQKPKRLEDTVSMRIQARVNVGMRKWNRWSVRGATINNWNAFTELLNQRIGAVCCMGAKRLKGAELLLAPRTCNVFPLNHIGRVGLYCYSNNHWGSEWSKSLDGETAGGT